MKIQTSVQGIRVQVTTPISQNLCPHIDLQNPNAIPNKCSNTSTATHLSRLQRACLGRKHCLPSREPGTEAHPRGSDRRGSEAHQDSPQQAAEAELPLNNNIVLSTDDEERRGERGSKQISREIFGALAKRRIASTSANCIIVEGNLTNE